jgi:trans-aconitate methyltransferase
MLQQQRSAFGRGVTPISAHFISLLVRRFQLNFTDKVLEIGCGEGHLARALAAHVAHVDAIDKRAARLATAIAASDTPKIRYIESHAQEFIPRMRYDLIISLESFHLIDDQGTVLRRLVPSLAPGGSFCVAWVEFFWESGLFESFSAVFSRLGVEWGSVANLAVVDLKQLAVTAAPEFELDHEANYVDVPERVSLIQIASYLSSTSKAETLSRLSKARLRQAMLRRFRQTGFPEEITGRSRYVAEFVRAHADDTGASGPS